MTDYTIPRANAPIAGQDAPTTQWYNYLRFLDTRTSSSAGDVQAEITTIAEKLGSPDGTVGNIPTLSSITGVQGIQSIVSNGINLVQLHLVNDAAIVPPIYYYGTDSAGAKGYNLLYSAFASTANITKINTSGIVSFDLTDLTDSGAGVLLATTFDAKGRKTGSRAATITGAAGRVTVANGDASAGLPTIDLATVTDAGGGALLRFVRDAWGRISGTSAASTSDLTEGSNLYFTNKRAQDAVGNILANTPDIDLAYNPSTPSISATLVQITANALTALTYPNVVALDGAGNAYYPDLTNPADVSRIVGVTTNAAAMGAPVGIVTSKTFTESAWGWSPGRIYCAVTGGALTQTAPATGAVVEVARVITPTTIRVGIQPAILR